MLGLRRRGIIFVVSGPSGVGKGTLCRCLLKAHPDMCFSVSVTTRPPRPGEKDGVEYFFVSGEEFERRARSGELLEWAEVYGERYGTPRSFVEAAVESRRDVLLDLDARGALSVKRAMPEAVLVYVLAPSMEEARRRLIERATECQESIDRRLCEARLQTSFIDSYDYAVINDRLDEAVGTLSSIISAERARIARLGPEVIECMKKGGMLP